MNRGRYDARSSLSRGAFGGAARTRYVPRAGGRAYQPVYPHRPYNRPNRWGFNRYYGKQQWQARNYRNLGVAKSIYKHRKQTGANPAENRRQYRVAQRAVLEQEYPPFGEVNHGLSMEEWYEDDQAAA